MAFHLSTRSHTGGEMSLGAKDRNVSPSNRPSSHDLLESATDHSVTKEHASGREDDSLIEHILDFLDKYPSRFAPQAPLTECMRAC
jgi:hypothetical protein